MHDDEVFGFETPSKSPATKRRGRRRFSRFIRWTIVIVLAIVAASWYKEKLAIGHREQQAVKTLEGVQAYTATWWGGVEGIHLAHVNADQLVRLAELELSTLRLLRLSDSDIGDDDLVHLKDLPTLVDLNLRGLPITDEGLPHIEQLPELMRVDLTDTQVTFEGEKKLQQAMPDTRIVRR